MPVEIIADIGACHEGDLETAKNLVAQAKVAGADVAKVQFWSSSDRLAARRALTAASYEPWKIPQRWLGSFAAAAEGAGIELMATVYLPEDVETLLPYVQRFKIASFEHRNRSLIKKALGWSKGLVISTGLAADDDLLALVRLRATTPRLKISLLHCISAYPASPEDLHLRTIREYGLDGFSDHTGLVETGAVAVAAGARILEAHLRLSCTSHTNPDFEHSLPPNDFARYVRLARLADAALGPRDWKRVPTPAERPLLGALVPEDEP